MEKRTGRKTLKGESGYWEKHAPRRDRLGETGYLGETATTNFGDRVSGSLKLIHFLRQCYSILAVVVHLFGLFYLISNEFLDGE